MVDVIILLGACVWADGKPSPSLVRRTLYAAKLWHAAPDSIVITTGRIGPLSPPSQAQVAADILTQQGVPNTHIYLDHASANTYENLKFGLELLPRETINKITITSDAYHLPRAYVTARALGYLVTTAGPRYHLGQAGLPTHLKMVLREMIALPFYAVRLLLVKGAR
ncbi:YdcF family protein [Cochlodiniinecator piscidefendens]|uniref:YdcF family protein n=1 Tax=Cochlodiniinecator piscidefendens TaxID=2715756 RepID=UPI00140B64FD|nr:YdcF family protein [Cochlodiniinecator piscidefendens]